MPAITQTEAKVLDALLDEGRREIHVARDRSLLEGASPSYRKVLSQLAKKNVLHRLGRGHYVIADTGSQSAEETAPWPLLVDARLRHLAPYYITYFSGLEALGLTDHAASEITVAVFGRGVASGRDFMAAGRHVHLVRNQREDRWFGFEEIFERAGSFQLAQRERVLLDILARPKLSGGPETVARAWGQAALQGFDEDRLVEWAPRLSSTVVRRAAVMLELVGLEEVASRLTPAIGSAPRAVALLGGAFDSTAERATRWRVAFDVPRKTVAGWIAYEQ